MINMNLSPGLLMNWQHEGKGTTERQKGPHANSAYFNPSGAGIIAVDLGTNELWFSEIDTAIGKLMPSGQGKLSMAEGAGPRHLTFHPTNKWICVVIELDCTITQSKDGLYNLETSYSTLPENFTDENYCADIHITSDGKFIYASNRGHNSIEIYEANQMNGSLKLFGHESTRGEWPRKFSLPSDDNYLLVANQHTNNTVSFKRNLAAGLLDYIDQVEAPTPVCILF